MITVRFVPEKHEYVRTTRGLMLRSRRLVVGWLALVAVCVVGIATGSVVVATAFLTASLTVLFVVVALPYTAWRRVRQLAADGAVYTFGPERIETSAGGQQSSIPWSSIASVRTIGPVYVMRIEGSRQIMVPRRAFEPPGDEQAFNALVAAHVGG